MRVPDTHLPKGLASALSTSSKNADILPILQKMESVDASDRKWACAAVSNLIQNDPSTRRLLQGKNVVGALITRLTDSEEEVIVEAAGSLRNLCIDGGYDICAEMYNKNILSTLKSFLPKISVTLSQYLEASPSTPENARKLVYEFSESVITILWCLSETSNKALTAINAIHLIPFLMSFLAARDKLPLAPVTAAAQSLYVLSDDNPPTTSELCGNPEYLSCLLGLVRCEEKVNGNATEPNDPRSLMLRVLAAGILLNLSPFPTSNISIDNDAVVSLLSPIVCSFRISDYVNDAQELIKCQGEPQIDKLSLKDIPSCDSGSPAKDGLGKLESELRTIQLALEVLTGACATLPDPEPNAVPLKENKDDGDEEMDYVPEPKDDPDVDMQENTPSLLPSLISPLLSLVHPTPLSFPPSAAPSPHPPITSALMSIHTNALECLNNLFLSLSTLPNNDLFADHAGGQTVWDEIWSALSSIGTQTGLGQEGRHKMREVAIGVLWGVGKLWRGCIEATSEQVEFLKQLCDMSSDVTIRVRCIGTLETVAQHPQSLKLNNVVAEYLFSLLPSAGLPSRVGTEPLIQVVSALIDIYSDENMPYDINFRRGGYLERLAAGIDDVKKAVRAIDRRKEGDLRRRAEEVRDNLVAFVQYRKDLAL